MKRFKLTTLLLVLAAVTLITAGTAIRVQDEGHLPQSGKGRLSKLPIVDYDAAEPSDPEQRAKRLAKSKTYNDRAEWRRNRVLNVETVAIRNDWDLGLESPLPVTQSVTVVVGVVVGSKAYLSEDKSNVYSEFMIRVEHVFKHQGGEPVAVGGVIATERRGGRVRVPSGRIADFYVSGQGVPEVGKRYVFFLGHNRREAANTEAIGAGDRDGHILTGYELREGRVFPMDVSGAKNFAQYEGQDETAFLKAIRDSIGVASPAASR